MTKHYQQQSKKTIKTITETINTDLKEYVNYVIENRAIPCYIDGFKPVLRTLLFAMLDEHKNKKEVKVSDMAGISKYGYLHGEQSAAQACVTMAADWNNNVPVFKEKGSFGSRLIQESAAARYIYVALNQDFYRYFDDFDVLEYHEDLAENPVPKTYLPNIPWVLVNGIQGIAVGFSCNYAPHSPKDVAAICLKHLNGKNIDKDELLPTFPGFSGEVKKESDTKYITIGKVHQPSRNVWLIEELPWGYDREKYLNVLIKLQDEGKIEDFDDNCSGKFNFTVKVTAKQNQDIIKNPIDFFKLEKSITENYTALDENGRLILFKRKQDIIKTFLDFRVKKINDQINHDLYKVNAKLTYNENRLKFVKDVLSNKVSLKGLTKQQLIDLITTRYKLDSKDESINKLISIPVYSMTQDAIKELENTIADLYNVKAKLSVMDAKEEMKQRLQAIIKNYKT